MKLAPQTAVLIRDEQEVSVPVEQVRKEDIFVVRPGEKHSGGRVIIEGSSAVNEAALTGESIPVDKKEGDAVSAATINQSGLYQMPGDARRRGYHAFADHQDGQRRRRDQSTDRQGSRPACRACSCRS